MPSRSPSIEYVSPENQPNHHSSGRAWTQEQTSLLQSNQEEYREASDAVRAKILGRVVQEMVDILPNGNSFNKEERAVVKGDVKAWFSRYSRRRAQKMPKIGQQWHIRRVFRHQHKEDIDIEAKRLCEQANTAGERRPKGGERTHFDFRERVVTSMMNELSRQERADLERTVEEYNKKGVDPELKSKLAVKNCTARIHAFSKELYDSMGVRLFVLGCFMRPDGSIEIASYDFNQELGNGKDYVSLNGRSFREEGISLASWQAHNEEYYSMENLTSAEGGHQGSRSSIPLEKNDFGEPVLLDPSKPPCRSAGDIRIWQLNLLRSFINQHYILAAGQEKGSTPWTGIGENLLEFVDEEHLPAVWRSVKGDHYKLVDPSRLSSESVTEALKHWFQRQEEGDIAFRFKAYLEGKTVRNAPPRKKITRVNGAFKGQKAKEPTGKGKSRQRSGSPVNAMDDPGSRRRKRSRNGKIKGQSPSVIQSESDTDEEDAEQHMGQRKKHKGGVDGTDSPGRGSPDSFWKINLGDEEYTDLREEPKKRKFDIDEAPDSKIPRFQYKVGPRNGRPGKVKHNLPFSPVIRDPVQRAIEVFPPKRKVEVVMIARETKVEFDVGRKLGKGSHSGPSDNDGSAPRGRDQPRNNANPSDNAFGPSGSSKLEMSKPKPRPKPRPIKASTGELGIVTRDRSKRIAEESIRATRSKKV